MPTLVMTIPGSGTNFLTTFLAAVLGLHGRNGIGDPTIGFMTQASGCDYGQIHPRPDMFKKWAELDHPYIPSQHFDAAIITLRHPYRSMESHRQGNDKWRIEDFSPYWAALIEEQAKYEKILYLCIDGPPEDRLPQLMAIATHFGKAHLAKGIRLYAKEWVPLNVSTPEDLNKIAFAVEAYEQWRR